MCENIVSYKSTIVNVKVVMIRPTIDGLNVVGENLFLEKVGHFG